MTQRHLVFPFATALLAAAAAAQGPDFLLTFSQPETTLSGSAGTSLQFLQPNEVAHLEWSNGPCSNLSAEKWAPRTAFHAMAGDENGDTMYWNPALFGAIDALVATLPMTPIAGDNARTVFWSPSAAMGTGVSGAPGLRPGDVGRIVRTSSGDGQVEHFVRQEQIDQALGLPITNVLDVDAIALAMGTGIFLSLDQDVFATTVCGPTFVQDGAVFLIPDSAITWTTDFRVAAVAPSSAVLVYTEAQMDAFVANAQVTNRFGTCLATAVDTESLEIDWNGAGQTVNPCAGAIYWVPDLIFSAETMTGASMLTTAFAGSIYNGLCGSMGRACGSGPTLGMQSGIQPTSSALGAPSYVNGLLGTHTLRYSLQARTPVLNSSPSGLPAGATLFDFSSPAPLNFVFVTFAPSGANAVPGSVAGWPLSLFGFPDFYPVNFFYLFAPTTGGFATFPSFAIPPNFPVKLLFQGVGVVNGLVEFSTPAMLDIL